MPLLQQVDPGGEIYLPFAKAKLRLWHAQMIRDRVWTLSRLIRVSDGASIHIDSLYLGQGLFRDRIRIEFGGVNGRLIRREGGVSGPHNAYLVVANRLRAYGVSDVYSGYYPRFSFNGRTYVWLDATPSDEAYISRRNRAAQTAAVMDDTFNPAAVAAEFIALDYAANVTAGVLHSTSRAASMIGAWASEDGKHVFLTEPRWYPAHMRISAAQEAQEALPQAEWTGATEFDTLLTGEPEPVTDFVAVLAGHEYQFVAASPNPRRRLLWYREHEDTGTPYYAVITTTADGMLAFPSYDYFNDRLLLKIVAQYVSTADVEVPEPPDGSAVLHVYANQVSVLFGYNRDAQTWTELDRRDEGPVDYMTWEETAGGGFNGLTGTDGDLDGVTIRYRTTGGMPYRLDDGSKGARIILEAGQDARLAWVVQNLARADTGTPPASEGALALDGATCRLHISGVAQGFDIDGLADPTHALTLCAWAPGGMILQRENNDVWLVDAVAELTLDLGAITLADLHLSSTGRQAWLTGGATERFYYHGVEQQTFTLPTADAAAYALYSATSPDGYWFLGGFVAWGAEADVAKLRAYTHVVELPTPPPPPGPPGPPPAAVYGWVSSVVKARYIPAEDKFEILETYATTGVNTTVDPGDSGSAALDLAPSELLQDEYIPHT